MTTSVDFFADFLKKSIMDEDIEGGLKELNKLISVDLKEILNNYEKFTKKRESIIN